MNNEAQLRLSDAKVELDRWRIHRGGKTYALTPLEHRLLSWLVANPNRVFSQSELLEQVWRYRRGVHSRTVYSTIQRLRKKLEVNPSHPRHIISVYGAGYCLDMAG